MKQCFSVFFALCVFQAWSQDSNEKPSLSLTAYVETYYSYDLGNPANHERPFFIYNFNRHNEFNLNIGYVKAAFSASRVRANIALMAGTYSQSNLAGEPGLLRNVFEANVGLKLSKQHQLWLDMGVLPSHIGFESAIGKDSWTLSRSLAAETSPYYESGARLSFISRDEKWYLAALLLNGWQRIQRPTGNQSPSFGTQLTFKPNADITLNWSTFIGNEGPAPNPRLRVFNNLYAQAQLAENVGVIAGFDIGMQERGPNQNGSDSWLTPVLIGRFGLGDQWKLGLRAEYYLDESGVIVDTGTPNGFTTVGGSANLDYYPIPNAMLRFETRWLKSRDPIFADGNNSSSNNLCFTVAMNASF
jgi:hypothetical protein